jgi:hypothetical protein
MSIMWIDTICLVGFEVLMAVSMKMAVFWVEHRVVW